MNLVIVESPTKARTISRFLGNGYHIIASMGHIMDLPKSTLGVSVENNFEPNYELMPDKKRTITELKSAAKTADRIILATDPDREGEAIASHIKDVLSSSAKSKVKSEKFQRIAFHEITDEAIKEALLHPRAIDAHLVDAQTARRVLDRLVGYKLSPLLWQKVRRGLSAGRVQSVALRLIVEREREIEKFQKEKYYTITATLAQNQKAKVKSQNEGILFELIEINSEKIERQKNYQLYDGDYTVTLTSIQTEEKAKEIALQLQGKSFVVADVLQKETKRSPQPPYTTSTLQQDAARRLNLPGKRTMMLAQKLYEEGFITYHRTDSVAMSHIATAAMSAFIKKEYGEKYVPEKPRFYVTKQKNAQEAHEAIRPTKMGVTIEHVSGRLGPQYGRLYDLIWRRALASQMSDALVESTTVLADSQGTKELYRFKANGSVLVFDGFLKVNPQGLQDTRLPKYSKEEVLTSLEIADVFHETPQPPRYNDASLIKTLEEKGIGRPSTYATIISTIEDRRYVERTDGRFSATSIGVAVNDFLVQNFSDVDDIPFTAEMEESLDAIASGEKEWVPMMKAFYTPFSKKLEEVKGAARVKIAVEEVDELCPECGAHLVIRTGRFGKFLSCSRFPECKFTKPFVEETNFTCPKDGGKVIVKKTRKGRKFFGCSNYPACDFAAWKLEDIRNYDPRKDAAKKEANQQTTN